MTRFNNVTYDAGSQTATVGAGLVWDDVYEALEPYDVNVVGGRVTGVGVAGFSLGGGQFIISVKMIRLTFLRVFVAEQSIRPHCRQHRVLRTRATQRHRYHG
jgi:hypothetical protein